MLTKMGHVSKTTRVLGVICHHFNKTLYSLPFKKNLRALSSAIPAIWMGHPKFTRGSAMAERPLEALVSRNFATTKHPVLKLESRA